MLFKHRKETGKQLWEFKRLENSLLTPLSATKVALHISSILKHINGPCGGWKGKYHHIKGPHYQVHFPKSKNMKRYATEN